MYRFREILIALDLSDTDDNLIKYGLGVANVVEAEEVIFMHVAKDTDLTKLVDEEGQTTLKEKYEEKINKIVNAYVKIAPNARRQRQIADYRRK